MEQIPGDQPFDRAVQEGLNPPVYFFAQPADLALRDAGAAHRLDQVIDGAWGDALDVSFLDNGRQRFLGRAAGLEE